MKMTTLSIHCFLLSILFTLSVADVVSRRYTQESSLDNKLSHNSLMTTHHSESLIECGVKCGERCACFGFNPQQKKCRIHQSCDSSDMTVNEAGWRYYCPNDILQRCSLLPSTSLTPCPVDWRLNGGTQYCFVSQSVQWASAKDKCISMGAHLVAIENAGENDWIENNADVEMWWTGGTNGESGGAWYWVHSNNTINPGYWSAGHPIGQLNQNCAVYEGGKLVDYACLNNEFYFICEKQID